MNDNLSKQTHDIAETFGFSWWYFFAQIVSLAVVVAAIGLPIAATIFCLRHHRSDTRLPLWLLLVWLVPIAGPLCTLIALRRQPSTSVHP